MGTIAQDVTNPRKWDAKGVEHDQLNGTSVGCRIAARVMKAVQRARPSVERLLGLVAFERLLGIAPGRGPYQLSASAPDTTTDSSALRKGDVCPAVVEEISLPPDGTVALQIVDISPRVRALFEEHETLMRRPDHLIKDSKITPYNDPNLEGRAARMVLLKRMARANMLISVPICKGVIAMFTVVKKILEHGAFVQRLIFDERLQNLEWNDPPWCSLGASTAFPYIDVSEEIKQGYHLRGGTGDIPDYYYRLHLPSYMAEYFCVEDITPAELAAELIADGQTVNFDAQLPFIAVAAMVMGWSWSVYIAQTVLEDILFGSTDWLNRDRQLAYGVRIPQITPSTPIHWEYIDDYAVLCLLKEDAPDGTLPNQQEMRRTLIAAGLPVHKEETGVQFLSLGWRFTMEPEPTVEPCPRKMDLLVEATMELCRRKTVKIEWVDSVVGMWAWFALVNRMLLSVFEVVYKFLVKYRGETSDKIELWATVKKELMTMVALRPLFYARLAREWCPTAWMTDASYMGGGALITEASVEELRAEAKEMAPKGWFMRMEMEEEGFAMGDCAKLEPEEGAPTMEFVNTLPRLPQQMLVFFFFHLFSGRRRVDDLEDQMTRLGHDRGVVVFVISIDMVLNVTNDLTNKDKVQELVEAVTARRVGAHAGPPCGTWTKARYNHNCPGPVPLRSREHPWGLPDLKGRLKIQTDIASQLLRATLQILMAVVSNGGFYTLEHPQDPGQAPFPSIWNLREVQILRESGAQALWKYGYSRDQISKMCTRASFDQCRCGSMTTKPTTLQGNLPMLSKLDGLKCDHPRGSHMVLRGVGPDGKFRTSTAQEYAPEFNKELAQMHMDMFLQNTHMSDWEEVSMQKEADLRASIFKTRRDDLQEKVKTPPVGEAWSPMHRWKEAFRLSWKIEEHQNVLELRTVMLALTKALTMTQAWARRHLIITDSMVSIGAILKGRSGSPALLRLVRRMAALLLMTDSVLYARWVESWRNHADGPSRGQAIGQAVKALAPRVRANPRMMMQVMIDGVRVAQRGY